MFTEEDLLEAVDILVEEYGIDEDEAINMISEQYEIELYNEGIRDYVGDPRNLKNSVNEFKQNVNNIPKTYKELEKIKRVPENQEKINSIIDKQVNDIKQSGKQVAKDAAIPAAATVVGGALLLRKAAKARKRRRLREDYGIFEDEYGELFIESEMVEYVMDEFDLYEEDAIEVIMESYEEELLTEGLMDRTQIPSEITYRRMINANKKAAQYKKMNAEKAAKYKQKHKRLEDKYKSQIKKFNKHENDKLARYRAKGKNPRTYTQISYRG